MNLKGLFVYTIILNIIKYCSCSREAPQKQAENADGHD